MKPSLVLGVICDYALISSDNKLSVIGIFHEINARQLPVVHPAFYVALQWLGSTGKYEEKVVVADPKGRELATHRGKFELKMAGQGHVSLIRYSPFRFDVFGDYRINVFLDGELAREIPFTVQEIREQ